MEKCKNASSFYWLVTLVLNAAFPQIQHAVHSVREGYSRAECKISAFVIRPCPDNPLISTVISISIVSIKLSISLIYLFILYLNSLPPSWTPKETFLRKLSKHSILRRHASRQSWPNGLQTSRRCQAKWINRNMSILSYCPRGSTVTAVGILGRMLHRTHPGVNHILSSRWLELYYSFCFESWRRTNRKGKTLFSWNKGRTKAGLDSAEQRKVPWH